MNPASLQAVRARLTRLRADPGWSQGPDDLCQRVRQVVVIGSSSRGGSSIFAEILRRTPQLLHLRAEINPFFVLHERAWPFRGDSDALTPADADCPGLSLELAHDCGTAADELPPDAVDTFAIDLAARLTLQWPDIEIAPGPVRVATTETLEALRRDHGWAPGAFPDTQLFHAHFLARIRRIWPGINPYFYDLPRALVARAAPDARVPEAPPCDGLVEEPPFVCVSPWRRASVAELAHKPLVIKTPSNAYRLPFLQALFPNAELRVLHLTRNVAASVNGLYDGWRFPGFWSHAVDTPLSIAGYTDTCGDSARNWWKFDLPPGWRAEVDRPLAQVCAFQWRTAHQHLLDWLDAAPRDHLRLRFEDVVGPAARQEALYRSLTRWLGISLDPPLAAALGGALPAVMATETPRRRRWFDRADLLSPVLADPANLSLMERLGYAPDPDTWL